MDGLFETTWHWKQQTKETSQRGMCLWKQRAELNLNAIGKTFKFAENCG